MLAFSPDCLHEAATTQTFSANPDRVDLWLLSAPLDAGGAYSSVLSREETARATRFHFAEDRARSLAARGGLRWILSAYSGAAPSALAFELGSHGKPRLSHPATPLEFNVSHSGACVLIAVTAGRACGVDIELHRVRKSEEAIAERFFCPREVEWLKETEGGFLRLWTAKEAAIKTVGRGLSIPLSAVDVTDVVAGRDARLRLHASAMEPIDLWIKELDAVSGYAAAVAVAGDAPSEIRQMSPR